MLLIQKQTKVGFFKTDKLNIDFRFLDVVMAWLSRNGRNKVENEHMLKANPPSTSSVPLQL